MNVGEALAYGLLGATEGAANHYYTDWRDRTKRARDQAAQKEGWKYQTSEREASQKHQSGEAEKGRKFSTSEREAGQLYHSGEAEKNRAFQRQEAETARQYLGKDGKGLLKSGTGGSGKSTGTSGPKSVKSGIGMQAAEGSIEVDAEGRRWQYVVNPQTNQWERIPVVSRETAPVISTQQQIGEAEAFAEETVNDLAGYFSTDATNFASWGGSREAAKEYFKRNYLNGTLFDDNGQLMVPGQSVAQAQPEPAPTEPEVQANAQTQTNIEEAGRVYSSLNPNQQKHIDNAIRYITTGQVGADAAIQRLLEIGFNEQQLAALGF